MSETATKPRHHKLDAATLASAGGDDAELHKGADEGASQEMTKRAAEGAVVAPSYADDAGAGFEDVGRDELLIPFLRVLQSNSPQCDETSGAYQADARPGMLINTATSELFDGKLGVLFLPVYRDHTFVEFVPRDAGGGFVGIWSADDPRLPALRAAQGQFGRLVLESGNELTETFSLYGLTARLTPGGDAIDPDAEVAQCVIGFSSTQIKAYKLVTTRLAGLIGSPKPKYPIFAHAWRVRSVPQKNKKGSFYGWTLGLLGGTPATALLKPNDPLYLHARDFHRLLKEGAARADYAAGAPDAGNGDPADADEQIPF